MSDAATSDMQDIIWLGRLAVANNFYCQLEPLAEVVEGKWVKVDAKKVRFPKQGYARVNKSDLGSNRSIGSLWVFCCQPSSIDSDQWQAVAPARAQPVVDLSEHSLTEARRRLFESGIQLAEHQARSVVVLLEGDTYCTLRFEKRGNLWIARTPEQVIELRRSSSSWGGSFRVNGSLYLPMRADPEAEVVRRLDLSTDGEFLAKVVARYRAAVNGYLSLASKGNEQAVRKLERALAEGHFGAAGAAEIQAIVERLRAEWPETSRGLQAVEEMSELLLNSDSGRQLLEDAVVRRKKELEVELEIQLRFEINERLAPLHSELDSVRKAVKTSEREQTELQRNLEILKREKDTLEAEHRKVEVDLSGARKALKTVTSELVESEGKAAAAITRLNETFGRENVLQTSIVDIRAALVEFAERARRAMEATGEHNESGLSSIAVRLEGLFSEAGQPVAPFLPTATPPWWSKPAGALTRITSAALPKRIAAEAEAHGVLTQDLAIVDGFARAGEIVLMVGDQAELAVSAYARAVAGGETRAHALDPSAIGLDDLWRVPSTGRPTAFALAWHRAATSPDLTVLLCLRDLDAAPFRLWLNSLHVVLQSPDRPRNLLLVATVINSGNGEEEFLGAELLRHHLVSVMPGLHARSSRAGIALGEPPSKASVLVPTGDDVNLPQPAALLEITKRGKEARVVRRAVRLSLMIGEGVSHAGQSLPVVWAGYLLDGRTDGLPPALSAGHDRLKTLHLQR